MIHLYQDCVSASLNADPDPQPSFHFADRADPAFHSNAHPDPGSKNSADLYESGFATLCLAIIFDEFS
jgi:hypothetical protein